MQWNDEGYLLSKVNYNENSIIIDVLTLNHGKCSGIIYGGTSKKIKNFLQIGNKLFLNFNSKNENRIGYFKTEIIRAIAPFFFNDKRKTSTILSAASILKILLPQEQENTKIFNSFESLMYNLFKAKWIISYIYWEQLLVKELGFDFNLFKEKKINNLNYKKNGLSLKIPEFFVMSENSNISEKQIKEALQFNKNLLISNFFEGNSLKIPRSRYALEKYYN